MWNTVRPSIDMIDKFSLDNLKYKVTGVLGIGVASLGTKAYVGKGVAFDNKTRLGDMLSTLVLLFI